MAYSNFEKIIDIRAKLQSAKLDVKTDSDSIRRVADSFQKNIARMNAFLSLSLALIDSAWVQMRIDGQFKKEGEPHRPFSRIPGDGTERIGEVLQQLIQNAAIRDREQIELGLGATLASVIIGAWTAFEAIATDLWVESVNLHPWGLAEIKGQPLATKNEDAEDLGEDEAPKLDKSVSLNMLQRHGYDISDHMGDILKNKFNFNVLVGIRSAYRAAWGKEDEMDRILKVEKLSVLGAVRNVLVHNGGIADPRFVRRVKGDSRFGTITPDQPITIDGDLAEELATTSVDCSCACSDAWTIG